MIFVKAKKNMIQLFNFAFIQMKEHPAQMIQVVQCLVKKEHMERV